MDNVHVLIAGAGPAGLTLALTLRQKGIPFTLLEGVKEEQLCSDVGGGYDLGANALRVYEQFGLKEEVKKQGTHFSTVQSFDSAGELCSNLALPDSLQMASVRRSTLQRILVKALGTENIVFGAKVEEVEEEKAQVTVRLENGKAVTGDLLIAADGVHSAVRRSIFQDGPADHVGASCLWGRLKWEDVPAHSREKFSGATLMLGKGQSFMGGHLDGLLIWTTFWQAEDFVRSETKELAREKGAMRLEAWNKEIAEIVRRSGLDKMVEAGIYDRPVAPTWHSQRTLLIGDAAHPMTPFLGLGANSAIADAFILGQFISNKNSIEETFMAFEKRRKAPLEKKVKTARTVCDYSLSTSKWKNWVMLNGIALLPDSLIKKIVLNADKVNAVADLIN